MTTLTVNVVCRTCRNEDEAVIQAPDVVFHMLPDGATLRAEAKVQVCELCKPPLILAR